MVCRVGESGGFVLPSPFLLFSPESPYATMTYRILQLQQCPKAITMGFLYLIVLPLPTGRHLFIQAPCTTRASGAKVRARRLVFGFDAVAASGRETEGVQSMQQREVEG